MKPTRLEGLRHQVASGYGLTNEEAAELLALLDARDKDLRDALDTLEALPSQVEAIANRAWHELLSRLEIVRSHPRFQEDQTRDAS